MSLRTTATEVAWCAAWAAIWTVSTAALVAWQLKRRISRDEKTKI